VGDESAESGAIAVSVDGTTTGGLYPDEGAELFALPTDSSEAPSNVGKIVCLIDR
jgi:hypothetical protein